MKIVYCLDSINNIGGIQRVTVTKANALSESPGNEIWVIVADNSGTRVFDVSPKVHFVDLAINYYIDDWKSWWYVLKGIFIKRHKHKKRLTVWLNRICPEIVVAIGQSEKFFLPLIRGDWVTIREYHFPRDYRRKAARSWFEKTSAWVGDCLDLFALRRYSWIVVLTQEDKEHNWKKIARVSVIPNPLNLCRADSALLEEKRVIAVGRLTYEKNFTSLIYAFSHVVKRFPEWRLDIFGDGNERDTLELLISELSLDGIVNLRGSSRTIHKEMLQSSMLALSSRFEGLSMAQIEALGCGLPVVSYACPYGPKDIITDGVDGFLVPVGDERMLADRICELIENDSLRRKMGAAALEKSRKYSLDRIVPMWMDLFEELVRQKRQG